MSIEQANAFRKFVDENEALQQQVMEGLQDGSLKLTALAKEHGFEVTAEEALGLLDQANPETDGELELTDFELSLVSGGNCQFKVQEPASWMLGLDGNKRTVRITKPKC